MPALGESVTEGTVTRWLKQEGDDVEVDEPLLEVSTDKVDTEIPSPVAGKLNKILVQEDDTVPVGADLAVIGGSGGGSAPAAAAEAPAPEPAAAAPAPAAPAPASAAPAPASAAPARPLHRRAPASAPPRHPPLLLLLPRHRLLPQPHRRAATTPRAAMPRPTSRRSCASWPPTTASTSRR
jgi:pyruvate dehydrogenase E2 component (dihydrolipoamide acetyltransferase)